MNSYAKIFKSIIGSSIWKEPDPTRLLWITLLVLSDKHGEVFFNAGGLAHFTRISEDDCDAALKTLLSPDPKSTTKDEDGRRLEIIEGGFRIINHKKYVGLMSREDRNARDAERARRYRARVKERSSRDDRDGRDASRKITDVDKDVKLDVDPAKKKNITEDGDVCDFDKLWALQKKPMKKIGRQEARKAFEKAIRRAPFETIFEAFKAYVPHEIAAMSEKRDPKRQMHMASWLNQSRWEDELPDVVGSGSIDPRKVPIDHAAPGTKQAKYRNPDEKFE